MVALQGIDTAGNVFYVGTFSKPMLPDIRVGYAIVPDGLVETFERMQRHTGQMVMGAMQLALAEFIGDGDFAAHIRRMTRIYRGRRDRLTHALASAAGSKLAITPPAGGMQLLARLEPGSDDCRLVADLAKVGITARPLSRHFTGKTAEHGLFLGFAAWNETEIDAGAELIGKTIARNLRAAMISRRRTEMPGRMFGIAPDQAAKGGRLRIADLPGNLIDRQARGLEQVSRGLKPDALNELNGRDAAGRCDAPGKCARRERDGLGEFLDRKIARDIFPHPFFRPRDFRVLARQIIDRHERHLGAPFIQQQIIGAGAGQLRSGKLADDRKHQIHLRHRRAAGRNRPIGDDDPVAHQFDHRIALAEQRAEPPGRGRPPAVQQSGFREQESACARRGERGAGFERLNQHVASTPAGRALQFRVEFVR